MSQEKDNKPAEFKLEIQIDEATAQGHYANLAVINHNDAEFTLDFIFVQPQAPRGKVCSRIITSPRHVKRLLLALEENLRKYEQAHGPVDAGPRLPAPEVGPYH